MELTDIMSILGTVTSLFALSLGVVNYRTNIDLTRRSVLLAEKKLLSDEFKEPLAQINNAVVQLLPVAEELRVELSSSLTELYRSVKDPLGETKYTNGHIPHHFSDLVQAITDEIMTKFGSAQFISLAQEQIRILNIVPDKDIYPFLDNNHKSDYRSFKCMENRHVVLNYGALCEVSSGGFEHFFEVEKRIKSAVKTLSNQIELSLLLKAMRDLEISNKTHIVKFHDDVDFVKNFNTVNSLLTLLNDEYDFGLSERTSSLHGLDVGYAVLFACKLQLLFATTDAFLLRFEPSYTNR
ncbi:hypothetical protein [Photobacterium leiognathi]|uniref:hypothetical protein n=1 Tax=Photobacterium leiognathi TaxID=553611 RepID=UPI0027340893|nr:hypothetical protein [Photobacterium leiognathi]